MKRCVIFGGGQIGDPEQIKNLAQGIMEKSGETVEQADVVKDIIREEQDHIIATREQYQQLEQSIRHSAEEIRKIAGETGRLSQQKEDILGNIGNANLVMITSMFVISEGFKRTKAIHLVASTVKKISKGSMVMVMLGFTQWAQTVIK